MKYKIFIPTKGRSGIELHTAKFLDKANIPYTLIVEANEYELYRNNYRSVVSMEGSDYGRLAFARTWIKRYTTDWGESKHWQLDDNIRGIYSWDGITKSLMDPEEAFNYMENFSDSYRNIGVLGPSYQNWYKSKKLPYAINRQTPSFILVDNKVKAEWRLAIEDTDFAMQVLTEGWCTVLFSSILQDKLGSGTVKGGFDYNLEKRERMCDELISHWPTHFKKHYRNKNKWPRISPSNVWSKFPQMLETNLWNPGC